MSYKFFEQQIAEFAAIDPTKETDGLVVYDADGEVRATQAANTHPDPARFFSMSPAEWLGAKKAGNLIGYWHSHLTGTAEARKADKAIADEIGMPTWIYSLETKRLGAYVPPAARQPLEGRRFIPLVHDCISLVWDYYRDVVGVELPFLERGQESYRTSAGLRDRGSVIDFRPTIEATGARHVSFPRRHDIIVMALASPFPNHVAVYEGAGVMIHQLFSRPSERTVYGGHWAKNTVFIFRHPLAAGDNDGRGDTSAAQPTTAVITTT